MLDIQKVDVMHVKEIRAALYCAVTPSIAIDIMLLALSRGASSALGDSKHLK